MRCTGVQGQGNRLCARRYQGEETLSAGPGRDDGTGAEGARSRRATEARARSPPQALLRPMNTIDDKLKGTMFVIGGKAEPKGYQRHPTCSRSQRDAAARRPTTPAQAVTVQQVHGTRQGCARGKDVRRAEYLMRLLGFDRPEQLASSWRSRTGRRKHEPVEEPEEESPSSSPTKTLSPKKGGKP